MSPMSKTSKTTKNTKKTSTTKKVATSRPTTPVKPRRRKGPALPIEAIELPRVPGHEYGQHRHVSALQPGDTIYVGTRANLSTLEVAEVRTAKESDLVSILALAIEFSHGGVLYTGNEQVMFTAGDNYRISVKNN